MRFRAPRRPAGGSDPSLGVEVVVGDLWAHRVICRLEQEIQVLVALSWAF